MSALYWTRAPRSSNVVAYHYDLIDQALIVEFKPKKNGDRSVYRHEPIASAFVDRLQEALDTGASVGKLIHELRFDKTVGVEPIDPSSLPQQSADAPELHTEVS